MQLSDWEFAILKGTQSLHRQVYIHSSIHLVQGNCELARKWSILCLVLTFGVSITFVLPYTRSLSLSLAVGVAVAVATTTKFLLVSFRQVGNKNTDTTPPNLSGMPRC